MTTYKRQENTATVTLWPRGDRLVVGPRSNVPD